MAHVPQCLVEFLNKSKNIFDNLLALAPPKPANLGSELDHYLIMDVEHVTDPIAWWYEHHTYYQAPTSMENLSLWLMKANSTIDEDIVSQCFQSSIVVLPDVATPLG
ncbi:hypothetical protein AZE42_12779 [Rhizopogon vesiculosus]|uniref:HAT C-terminal dimerisation domain-containing protein n=1 Tax=Rhizopogon vesiculosus TaxID=180088 RepID=A0A1J8REF1_9AGAM|nr:hypothetical protein AZE42_12779 [Rhizopogon vesiculosus]